MGRVIIILLAIVVIGGGAGLALWQPEAPRQNVEIEIPAERLQQKR